MIAALAMAVVDTGAQRARPETAQALLGAALHYQDVEGDLEAAIATYQKIVADPSASRVLKATALLGLGACYEKLGNAEGRRMYERVVREYGDQSQIVAKARNRIAALAIVEPDSPRSGIVARQIWTGDKTWAGLPSPDGRYLPWISPPKLMLRDLTTGTDRVLDADNGGSASPLRGAAAGPGTFTPDGRHLVYGWYEDGTWNYLLKVIDVNGSSKPRILHKTDYYRSDFEAHFYDPNPAAVSPDGTSLAVNGGLNRESVIGLIDIASGRLRILKAARRVDYQDIRIGNFSPDGRYLAYASRVKNDSEDWEVRSFDLTNSAEQTLVGTPGDHGRPHFTPDGSHVVFTSNRSGGRWDLWSVAVDAGRALGPPALVKADVGQITSLGFTRDGAFHFRAVTVQEDALTVAVDPATGDVQGAPKHVASGYVNSTFAPSWSPDGTSIAYLANVAAVTPEFRGVTQFRIVVRTLDTGHEREFLVPFRNIPMLYSRYYRWFPDGRALLLVHWDNLREEWRRTYRRLDLSTGEITTLGEVRSSNHVCGTVIAPDGRAIFHTVRDRNASLEQEGQMRWVRWDLDTGEERTFSTVDGLWAHPSRDGRQFLFLKNLNKLWGDIRAWIAPLEGGAARELASVDGREFQGPNCSTWNPNDRGVFLSMARSPFSGAFFNSLEAEPHEIWWVPFDGGAPRNTGIAMQHLQSLTMRPDGRELGFTGGMSSAQVWSLRNLFPAAPRAPSPH
jgi:Tol biopolymer transport system component